MLSQCENPSPLQETSRQGSAYKLLLTVPLPDAYRQTGASLRLRGPPGSHGTAIPDIQLGCQEEAEFSHTQVSSPALMATDSSSGVHQLHQEQKQSSLFEPWLPRLLKR